MKSIRDINDLKVNLDKYVSYSIRESLGIIVLSFSEKEIVIGAMNPNYIKVIVDGNILGSGGFGSGGGILNNASNADLKVSGSGLVRGGGATTGAIRDALQGPSDINDNTKDIPRIFNF